LGFVSAVLLTASWFLITSVISILTPLADIVGE